MSDKKDNKSSTQQPAQAGAWKADILQIRQVQLSKSKEDKSEK